MAVFVLFGLGLTSSAGAATYNYYLQVGADGSLGAWTLSWQSSSLTIPSCDAGGAVSGFTWRGLPSPSYFPATVQFCLDNLIPILNVIFGVSGNTIDYTADFSAASPPSAPGVFYTSETGVIFGPLFGGSPGAPPIVPGPPATLTISNAISFPAIPRWFGTVVRVLLTAGPVTPPPGTPVEASVGFVDLNGNPIVQLPAVQIVAGQVTSFELNTTLPLSALGQHFEVVPVVSPIQGQSLPPLQMTVEVMDRLSGYGTVYTTMTGLFALSALAPQGLAGGQVMRVTATAYPPDPCSATLSFANALGSAIGPALTVNLAPGHSQSLDLTGAMLNLGAGSSAVVQPMVALQAPVSSAVVPGGPACMIASDVFDQTTGRTWTYQSANVR